MRYRSKPTECEAMQFAVGPDDHGDPAFSGEYVARWVKANGGEAYFSDRSDGPRIAVRTINGWAYAAPGHYIIMGSATWNQGPPTMRVIRDFYPCDPETFERRWEPGELSHSHVDRAVAAIMAIPRRTGQPGWNKGTAVVQAAGFDVGLAAAADAVRSCT